MAFAKIEEDLSYISKLDDEPNDVGGLTAAELKAEFDRAGNFLKDYINGTLLPALETGGAGSLGIEPPLELLPEAGTVLEALEALAERIKDATVGQIPDRSLDGRKLTLHTVTDMELADGAVTGRKLAVGAVGSGALAEKAVTAEKLGDRIIGARQMTAGAVGTEALADKSVTKEKLAPGVIGAEALEAGSITGDKLAPGTIGPEKTYGLQRQHSRAVAILTADGWGEELTQKVTVSGVTEECLVLVSPAPKSWAAYGEAGIRCTGQEPDGLTFAAETAPEGDVDVNVVLFSEGGSGGSSGGGGSGGGTGGTMIHGELQGRDAAGQHPIEAISGLEELADEKISEIWNGGN